MNKQTNKTFKYLYKLNNLERFTIHAVQARQINTEKR